MTFCRRSNRRICEALYRLRMRLTACCQVCIWPSYPTWVKPRVSRRHRSAVCESLLHAWMHAPVWRCCYVDSHDPPVSTLAHSTVTCMHSSGSIFVMCTYRWTNCWGEWIPEACCGFRVGRTSRASSSPSCIRSKWANSTRARPLAPWGPWQPRQSKALVTGGIQLARLCHPFLDQTAPLPIVSPFESNVKSNGEREFAFLCGLSLVG